MITPDTDWPAHNINDGLVVPRRRRRMMMQPSFASDPEGYDRTYPEEEIEIMKDAHII